MILQTGKECNRMSLTVNLQIKKRSAEALRLGSDCELVAADDEQVSIVLRIDSAFTVQRSRRIGCTDCQLLEDLLQQAAALSDGIQIAVLAVGIDNAVGIYHRRVH